MIKNLPFPFAKSNEVLLEWDEARRVPVLYHSRKTPFSVLQEVCRLNGPVERHLEESEPLLKRLGDSYARAEQNAAQVVDEVGEGLDLSKLLQDIPESVDLMETTDDAPVIRMINSLLRQATRDGASDVHMEAFERQSVVRFRVDGELRDVVEMRPDLHAALVSRIKIMAALDIAEKRLPQDGRISIRVGGRAVDIRVSTLPTAHGERVVMRLLEKNYDRLDLKGLLVGDTYETFNKLLHKPHGIVLVTGPTGSGKTTTLYASLWALRSKTSNIMTVEDPVEYDLEGIGQIHVNSKIDMTFARALRAILRQDPDIVMIGEIRDLETAQIAVQASLTGHLVLATLHTNNAPAAVTRLMDMGVEPFLLASSLLGVLAQRLVRRCCPQCHGTGCEACNQTGYAGRGGIYELMEVNEPIRELMNKHASEAEIRKQAIASGMRTLAEDCERLVQEGKTTREEMLRVTGSMDLEG